MKSKKTAIWVVTPNGLELAARLTDSWADADLFVSARLDAAVLHTPFERLKATVENQFGNYSGHIFITATGIAVRVIAPLLQGKTRDPAVVVLDEAGRHAISLLSGHIGGANVLAEKVAGLTGARPVITTATDLRGLPAIDTLAVDKGLVIENPAAIKTINMAFIRKEKISLYDPDGTLTGDIPEAMFTRVELRDERWPGPADSPGVYVSDRVAAVPEAVLVLRPKSLAAGIGCNRGTDKAEIKTLLRATLEQHQLSAASLKTIASIDLKSDELGLQALSAEMEIPLVFYNKQELNSAMGIQNPSAMVETHTGAKSVCEAAAILATGQGSLVVPKKKSKNVTVAIARAASI